VKSKNGVGLTPLSRPARGGHKAVVKLLLEKGAEKLLYLERLRRRRC
jgi:ankyrin repeat protein